MKVEPDEYQQDKSRKRAFTIKGIFVAVGAALGSLVDAGILHGEMYMTALNIIQLVFGR